MNRKTKWTRGVVGHGYVAKDRTRLAPWTFASTKRECIRKTRDEWLGIPLFYKLIDRLTFVKVIVTEIKND